MNILWLFDSCGAIVGLSIMAAGLAALIACAWMTFRPTPGQTRRRAFVLSLLPAVLGVCGFVYGLIICWVDHISSVPWLVLGKMCLAGAVISAIPLLWTLFLIRSRDISGQQVQIK